MKNSRLFQQYGFIQQEEFANSVDITVELDKEDPLYQKKFDYLAKGPLG